MKRTAKRAFSLILALAMIFSLLATFPLTAGAASYSYNTGERGVTCTSLSVQAEAYYTGDFTYSKLSSQSGSTLRSTLQDLMTDTQTKVTTYAELRTLSIYSDTVAGSTSQIDLLYSSDSVSGAWDNGQTWNREHVWPQSLGTFTTSNAGSDLHHLRPADSKVNNTRGNLPYGVVKSSGSYQTATSAAGTVSGYYNSLYFEPLDSVKGDVARILLYVYVRWGEDNLSSVCQSTDMLLEWMQSDPVDEWEMSRNDVVQEIEGNRNVFIDYPELAWRLFGKSVPSGATTPSGTASGTSATAAQSSSYTLVTSASQLKQGATVVIASSDYNYAMGRKQNTNNRPQVAITKNSDKTISFSGAVGEFTLGAGTSSGTYSFYDNSNKGYLCAASSSANYLRTQNTLSANSSWKISVTSSGVATITAQGSYTRNVMKYNKTNSLFSCYSTTQNPIALYVKTTTSSASSGSGTSSSSTGNYSLVKSASNLTSGKYILVVKAGGSNSSSIYYAMKKAADGSSYLAAVSADSFMNPGTASNNITVNNADLVWTLTGTSSGFTLSSGDSVVYNSNNNLYYKAGTATKWSAVYDSSTRTFQISSGGRYLGLRDDLTLSSTTGNPRFRCNTSASTTSYQFYLYRYNG